MKKLCPNAWYLPNEIKYAPVNLGRVDSDGSFEGHAALFERQDLARDVISFGAFAKSLEERGPSGIKMLFQHDPNEPIGAWVDIHEDRKGLFVSGQLMKDVSRGREVLSLMRAGVLDGLSIGFRTVKGRRDPASGIRRLEQIDLWEISIVTFPMQPGARVSSVKCGWPVERPTERELERWLTRDAGFTRSQARSAIRSGPKSLVGKQDAAGGPNGERLVSMIKQAASVMRNSC